MTIKRGRKSGRARWWSVPVVGALLLGGLTAALQGCGEPAGVAAEPHFPVKGKVTLPDGKPLAAGKVVFVSSKALEFFGTVESDGAYTMKTPAAEGLPEGSYKIRLEVDESKLPPAQGRPSAKRGKLPFPAKYSDELTSGLTATVTPGDNDIPLKLDNAPVTAIGPGAADKSRD
jgi:hypothetical protein